MVKKSSLKQKPLSHRVSQNKIKKAGKRLKKVVKHDGIAQQLFNPKETVVQNMVKYNLCVNPNNPQKSKELIAVTPAEERNILPYNLLLREEEDSIWKRIVTPTEQSYLEKLESKYKRDYKRMALDVKLNNFQYTAKQLQKKFAKLDQYKEWNAKRSQMLQEKQKQRQLEDQERKLKAQQEEDDSDDEEQAQLEDQITEMSSEDDSSSDDE